MFNLFANTNEKGVEQMNIEVRYKIRLIRLKKGITLRELERISGVSRSEISAIERNKIDAKLTTLLMIALSLKVNITDLFDIVVHK